MDPRKSACAAGTPSADLTSHALRQSGYSAGRPSATLRLDGAQGAAQRTFMDVVFAAATVFFGIIAQPPFDLAQHATRTRNSGHAHAEQRP